VKALAAEFKILDPKPLGGGPREVAAAGKKIYEEEFPKPMWLHASIVTAQTPKATDHFRGWPVSLMTTSLALRLRKLVNWSKERGQDPAHPDTSALMEPVAHGLNESQIRAVAAYLSNLE